MKLQSTKSKELNHISALLVGDSGAGKTTSLGTLPESQTLLAVCERSVIPLRNHNFPLVCLESWQDVRELLIALKDPNTVEDTAIKKAVTECRFVAIDSLTEINHLCIQHILGVERKKLLTERTGGKTDTPDNIYSEQLAMEDYQLLRTRMANMVSAFTHLPKHIIFTSLAQWTKDKNDCETYRTPALSGKLAREIPCQFDLCLFMASDKEDDKKRKWQTFNDGETVCKDASGVLERYEEPNWTSVYTKILKNGSAKA